MEVSLKHNIPVIYGVLNSRDLKQAQDRAGYFDPDSNLGISWGKVKKTLN